MKIKKIIIGSRNKAKINDWIEFLGQVVEISGLGDKNLPEPEETGVTFSENAAIKASYYAKKLNEYVLSDDGGFEIDFLGGLPGVKSRRILPGDKDGTDQELIDFVLEKMKDIPGGQRTARIIAYLALSDPKGNIIYQDKGMIEGVVSKQASKTQIPGYPYRSVLYLPQFNKYFNELNEEEHEKVNHRKAMAKRLIQFLQSHP